MKAVTRYELDQALQRWTEDAIVWVPDRMPDRGRPAIRSLLADDDFATRGPFHTRDLTLAGGTACETGVLGTGPDRLNYLNLWTRARGGEWQVSREIWDI